MTPSDGQTVEHVLTDMMESGLLSPEDGSRLMEQRDAFPHLRALADTLVKSRMISEFQSRILFEGGDIELRLNNYLLVDHIGDGGMGQVFKARDCNTGKTVAVKLLHPTESDNKSAVRRFEREITIASQLSHPNIVATIESGTCDGRQFLVMEFVDGHDLASLVRDHEALPISTAVDCILRAAAGLEYAHANNIIHRDIKPSNLLLSRSGEIRLLDMGLVRVTTSTHDASTASTQTQLTKTGSIMGTIDFMAPEQAINPRNADHRSDIYGLGCTLFFLLSGKVPFTGETAMEVLVAHREHPIPSLRAVRDDVPESLDRIFAQMMAKQPEDRFQSATELYRALETCRRENGMAWLMQKVKAKTTRR